MTANKKTLKALKATAAFKVFQASGTKDIPVLSAEEIAQASPVAHYLKKKNDWIYNCFVGFLAVYTAFLCILVFITPPSTPELRVTIGYAIVAILLVAVIAKVAGEAYYEEVPKFVQTLKPLNELGECERALALAKQFTGCNDYRESVLGQGREFLVLDLNVMERIAKNVEDATRSDRTIKACKELHGIPA